MVNRAWTSTVGKAIAPSDCSVVVLRTGHHVENLFRMVEKVFGPCPEPFKAVARLVAMAHVHFGYLKLRSSGSTSDLHHPDMATDDLAQMAAYHGLAFALPLLGQLLGGTTRVQSFSFCHVCFVWRITNGIYRGACK
jgi:hypothetical protein